MKVSLLTDAPKHNLALMKLSAYHKASGDEVVLNMPLWSTDKTYASLLFTKSLGDYHADEYGGPALGLERTRVRLHRMASKGNGKATVAAENLPVDVEGMVPDYDAYPHLDYSLGYTYRPCHRGCAFCIVGQMNHPDTEHHSIWEFHNPTFKKICLLNNNTFMDPQWKETFEEIWDAGLAVIDENGYDLRLLDGEKAEAIKKTTFTGKLHFAWDRMKDERSILRGLALLDDHKLRASVYVLVGYNTTQEEDLYRCQKIIDAKCTPYVMPYGGTKYGRAFKRFIDSFMWRKYKTISDAWNNYAP